MMTNIPELKLGLVSVSRDCFPMALSVGRRDALAAAYAKYGMLHNCPVCIESETDVAPALADLKAAGVNALVIFLGNFGPETAETTLAKQFDGPVMFCAAAEESGDSLLDGRGDAYCGMLNASYNLNLRGVQAYIPQYPVGTAADCAAMIRDFVPVATALLALSDLKIISFGPRPQDFLACNAPIAPLHRLGIEIEENSELDLYAAFHAHAGDARIPDVVAEMEEELGEGNKKPEILAKLAQYELTLLDWVETHKGARKYVAIAGKCWPAFQTEFQFVPCYVNSRLTAKGIPVSCEMKYQKIMARTLPVEYTNGTLEGDIAPGPITFFRLQSTADCRLRGYVAEGEVLPVPTRSFGGIGVFAIPQMGRFYRHVLIEKNFPHHGAVAFGHYGKAIFDVLRCLGVTDVGFNQPQGMLYPTENPFA